jgi:NAD(P)-dependent dehydrogenase (short-subunit alcohol dehydrogenase family)
MSDKSQATTRAGPSSGKLAGKVALINDGDTGIGGAVAELFAYEGAEVSVSCLAPGAAASKSRRKPWLTLSGDPLDLAFCIDVVERTLQEYGGLDILVNDSASIPVSAQPDDCPATQLGKHFDRNLLSMLFMTQSALFYMSEGGVVLNTVPFQKCHRMPHILDHLATRLAVISFTYALAQELTPKRIRVNAVSPGSRSLDARPQITENEGGDPQPQEIAPSYLYLASSDSSCMTGQVLYPLN